MASSKSKRSWRDVYPIHPAANIFPMMSAKDLRALAEDIRVNTLQNPVLLWNQVTPNGPASYLLDGRNRLDALELAQIPVLDEDGHLLKHLHTTMADMSSMSAGALVVALNIKRRHLSADERGKLAAAAIVADREFQKTLTKSNGAISETTFQNSPAPRQHRATGKPKGRPKTDVSQVADAAGISRPTARKALKDAKRPEVERMIREGYKRDEIVKAVHVNPNFVTQVKRELAAPASQPSPVSPRVQPSQPNYVHTFKSSDKRALGILHELEELDPSELSDPATIGRAIVTQGQRLVKGLKPV